MNALVSTSGYAGMAQPRSSARLASKLGLGIAILAMAVVMAAGGLATASVIAWGPATDVSGDSDVSTSGTLVAAYSLGNNPNSGNTNTVNGVDFTPVAITASAPGPASVSFGGDTLTSDAVSGYDHFGAPASFTAAYQSLLTSAAYESTGNIADPLVLTLNNLTVGRQYQFETWVNDTRSFGASRNETVGSSGDSVTLAFQTGTLAAGQFVLGTFTADSTGSQVIAFTGNQDAQINAFQLRAVPEPAALGLLAIGGLGLLLLKQRRMA